jgi:excisionase family DNA binding protein
MHTDHRSRNLLTVFEAAELLRQALQTVRRKIRDGERQAVRLGEHGPLRVAVASSLRICTLSGRARPRP